MRAIDSMSVQSLTKVVSPPSSPLEVGTKEDWALIERLMGIQLPIDLYDLCVTYGSGWFMGIQIYNPFSSLYRPSVEQDLEIYPDLKQNCSEFRFNFYPEQPGLYPCGTEENGGEIFWLADGRSDQWPLVLFDRLDSQVLNMTLTTFLANTFAMELECIWWDSNWQEEEFKRVTFRPETMA